jgi:glycosyltransferase involved in cell wall biosynthesis
MQPDISVLIPVRNEERRIAPTIQAIARARTTGARVEFVVVDDASEDDCIGRLIAAVPGLLDEPNIDIRVGYLPDHAGVYRARNEAARHASADILFMTDAHVRFSPGWDSLVFRHIGPERVLSATVVQKGGELRGYGCRLVVPFMGTHWNYEPVSGIAAVQIAPCNGTVLTRSLFERLGGYDPGMLIYGAGEPEFSLRAWLHGAEICLVGGLEVEHRFKPQEEMLDFIAGVRPYWVHNCIRFGLLYLSEFGCLQLLRFYSQNFPNITPTALLMIEESDLWARRAFLESRRERSFAWFVQRFGVTDQLGRDIL